MARNDMSVTPSKTDRYGTHFTCWAKEKTDKKGNKYIEGFVWLGTKAIKIVRYSGREGVDKKGNVVYPIQVSIFKVEKQNPISL